MNGRAPTTVPSAAEAKQAMISHLAIGCGDFQTIKYASASNSTSPITKIHLGTFQFVASFIRPVSEKCETNASKRLVFSSTNHPVATNHSERAHLCDFQPGGPRQ